MLTHFRCYGNRIFSVPHPLPQGQPGSPGCRVDRSVQVGWAALALVRPWSWALARVLKKHKDSG